MKEKNPEHKNLPRQMYLEEAHPRGYDGLWGLPSLNEREDSVILDPERKINKMHYRKRPGKIHEKDFNHWWGEQLKAWGFTDANKRRRLEETMREAVDYLKENGVWHLAKKPSHKVTIEEIKLIHEILSSFPLKDPYASDGFTIYPNAASWMRDIYGERE